MEGFSRVIISTVTFELLKLTYILSLPISAGSEAGQLCWPSSSYGLPQARTGCPQNCTFQWETGSQVFIGNISNRVSEGHNLPGSFDTNISLHFCTKGETVSSLSDNCCPSSNYTEWPRGCYCIFKRFRCPLKFNSGTLHWNIMSVTNGSVPDGSTASNYTGIEFCCRCDGPVTEQIELPTDHDFYLMALFPQCQAVSGMQSQLQYVIWYSDETDLNFIERWTPAYYTFSTDIIMHFCYYTPVTISDSSVMETNMTLLMSGTEAALNTQSMSSGFESTQLHTEITPLSNLKTTHTAAITSSQLMIPLTTVTTTTATTVTVLSIDSVTPETSSVSETTATSLTTVTTTTATTVTVLSLVTSVTPETSSVSETTATSPSTEVNLLTSVPILVGTAVGSALAGILLVLFLLLCCVPVCRKLRKKKKSQTYSTQNAEVELVNHGAQGVGTLLNQGYSIPMSRCPAYSETPASSQHLKQDTKEYKFIYF